MLKPILVKFQIRNFLENIFGCLNDLMKKVE